MRKRGVVKRTLQGLNAAELSHKKADVTSNGFVRFFAYIGAACTGYPLGYITHEWGWQGFYWALLGCCVIALVLLALLWSISAATMKSKKNLVLLLIHRP
jgi:OPA family sugar phosphate sensor protein UhpC-like MFS transporter